MTDPTPEKIAALMDMLPKGPTPGKKNIYVCQKCFGHIITRDLVEGVTPFMMKCRVDDECGGRMESSMYRVFRQDMRASHEWYAPDAAELATQSHGVRDHCSKGGLLLRKCKPEEKSGKSFP